MTGGLISLVKLKPSLAKTPSTQLGQEMDWGYCAVAGACMMQSYEELTTFTEEGLYNIYNKIKAKRLRINNLQQFVTK